MEHPNTATRAACDIARDWVETRDPADAEEWREEGFYDASDLRAVLTGRLLDPIEDGTDAHRFAEACLADVDWQAVHQAALDALQNPPDEETC